MASLARIKPGDIVKVNRAGRIFYAIVREKQPRLLSRIEPITHNVTYTTAKGTEVVEHYSRR